MLSGLSVEFISNETSVSERTILLPASLKITINYIALLLFTHFQLK